MTDQSITHDVELEAHRASCSACQALWAELEAISAEAKQLPTLTPSRDLWAGIEARITAPGVAPSTATPAPTVATAPRLTLLRSNGWRLAMAASLLVAVTSVVTWRLATSQATRPNAALASLPTDDALGTDGNPESREAASDEAAEMYLASFTASVTQMDREIAALQSIVTERRGELDPRTVEVLEKNLQVIDAAIAEARAALASDPASQFLAQQFTRAYTSKLTLLRGAAQLPAGI